MTTNEQAPILIHVAAAEGSQPPSHSQPNQGTGPSALPPTALSSLVSIGSPSPDVINQFNPDALDERLLVRTDVGLGRRQLRAMLKKNYLLKRRAWCQTICEILAPVFLTLMILVGYRLSANSATITPPTIYVNQTYDVSSLLTSAGGVLNVLNIPGIVSGSGAPTATGGSTLDPLAVSGLIRNLTTYAGPLPVPSFDAFVGVHDLLHSYLVSGNDSTLEAVNRLSIADARFNVLVNLGKLSFAPDTPNVHSVVNHLRRSHLTFNSTFDKIYASEDDAVNYALRDFTLDPDFNDKDPYVLRSWAVIVFDELDLPNGIIDYTIRMNYSVIPSTRDTTQKFLKGYDTTYQRYFLSGYMTLQLSIEDAIIQAINDVHGFAANLGYGGGLRNVSSTRSNFGSLMTAPMPVSSAYSNPFFASSGPFVGLVLCLSLLYPVSRLIKLLVEDKESRLKETLKMMGLYNWVFVTSYGITYFIIFFVIAVLQTLLMGGSVMQHSSKPLLFVYFFFFSISMLSLAFLISVFFSKAKLAGIVGPIISFAFVMPRYAFLTTADGDQISAKLFTCILSPTAFAFAMDNYMLYEGAQVGVTFKNASDEPISVGAMIGWIFFDTILYGVLAWYFEQVLPNEYGTNRSALFLFTKAYWSETFSRKAKGLDYEKLQSEIAHEEALAAANHHGQPENPLLNNPAFVEPIRSNDLASKARLIISHLHKVFYHGNSIWNCVTKYYKPNKNQKSVEVVAVKDLSLTMYEGQITCLLGHNGAGKSTTISMLTGLYKPTSGNCWINGLSITNHMHQIRQNLGICPQHNVLLDTLTVAEHLELFAILKGTPQQYVKKAVEDKIIEVGLQSKTNVYSQSLSGGMKRKLQVGCALIGDSKVVFLDEPTSGMDPYSRRSTWELLKRAKRGRVIVLTTHFMDEADLLGDRIAIIASGQLRAIGSSLFLKNKFGIGYNLTLVYQREELPKDDNKKNRNGQRLLTNGHGANGHGANGLTTNSSDLAEPLLAADHHEVGQLGSAPTPARVWTMAEIRSFIQAYVPSVKDLSDAAGEISFQLPLDAVTHFGQLFSALDQQKSGMGIAAYGVAMTTLEEVFIKIAHEELYRTKQEGGDYVRDEVEDAAEKAATERLKAVVIAPKKKKKKTKRNNPTTTEPGASSQPAAPTAATDAVELVDANVATQPQQEHSVSKANHLPTPSLNHEFVDHPLDDEPMNRRHQVGTEVAASASVGQDVPASAAIPEHSQSHSHAVSHSHVPMLPAPSNERKDDDGSDESEYEDDETGEGEEQTDLVTTHGPTVAQLPPSASPPTISPSSPSAQSAIVGDRAGERYEHAHWRVQVKELLRKRYLCATRDLLGRFFEVILPVGIVALVLLILTIQYNPAGPSLTMGSQLYQVSPPWQQPSTKAQLLTPTPAHSKSTSRSFDQTTVNPANLYYPSTVTLPSNTTFPKDINWGVTPVPLHTDGSGTDNGLLYTLGLSNPYSTANPTVSQPFYLKFYPDLNNSYDLSLVLLDDIQSHTGRRVGSYCFADPIRVFAPLSDDTLRTLQQQLLDQLLGQGYNTSSSATINIPIQYQNISGALAALNITSLQDLINNIENNQTTSITIPGSAIPITGTIDGTGELTLDIPSIGGLNNRQVQINLNDLVQNATTRLNGTNQFQINAFGFNFTLNGTTIGIPPGTNITSLNITQVLQAIENQYPTTNVTYITIPAGTLISLFNTTNTTFLRDQLDRLGFGESIYPVTLLHNVTQYHAVPSFASELFRAKLSLMYSTLVQTLSPDAPYEDYANALETGTNLQSSVSYTVRNHPLPLTTQSILTIRAILAIFAALFVLIPFCYLPASFVIFVVKERNSKAKHLQLVSGVSSANYWISTYIFDMINYFCVCIAVILVFLAYNNESFTGDAGTAFATFLLFVFYGLAVIPLSYAISFMFQNHTSAQVGIASILFILGFVLTIGSFILTNITLTAATNESLKPFYRLSPPYCLGEGMINLATRSLYGLIAGKKQSVWDWEITGRLLVYLPLEAIGYMVITMGIEYSVPKRIYKLAMKKYFEMKGKQAGSVGADGKKVAQGPNGLMDEGDEESGLQLVQIDQPQSPSHQQVNGHDHSTSKNELLPQKLFTTRTPSISRKEGQAAHDLELSVSRRSPRATGQGLELGATAHIDDEEHKDEELSHSNLHSASQQHPSVHATGVSVEVAPGGPLVKPHPLASAPSFTLTSVAARANPAIGSSDAATNAPLPEDDDVIYERRRVETGAADGDLIVLKHLRKTFGFDGKFNVPCLTDVSVQLPFFDKPMVAVKDLSLSVPAGQCFGFLGINGAGKTTTMSMLTGELEPDAGCAFLNGYDVVTQLEKVRQELGYCPQFDPLLDLLTAREHLIMYGRIRGIPEEKLTPLVQHLIEKLGLTPFADNITETYSGGNKRKASLALALIGNPSVVFLDEPSTGMDPVSRRFMWSIIADLSKSMSIVLTTHSMEECEALCARIGIMVNGQLACIGSLEHLKQKYGRGFQVEIHTSEHRIDAVRAFIHELFEGAEEQEYHAGRIKYLIPKQSSGNPITLAQIFSTIESKKAELDIADYGVGGASLEQIFVQIAKGQDQKTAELRANHNDAREARNRGD